VFNAIVRLEDSYSQKKVSDSFYKSNIVKLKSAYWDMESKPLYQKKGWGIFAQDTVGTSMVKKINDLSSGLSDSTGANAVRFDATVIANNVLKGIGIDANSTNPVDIGNYNTALQKEMPKIIRKIYPEQVKNLTDDQIKANQIKILADIKSKKNLGTVKAFTNKESSLDKEDWSK